MLVDWNWVRHGHRHFDLAGWLPSLQFEGGPAPERFLPDAPGLASIIAGFFASRAGFPIIPHAPYVRQIQKIQLSTALPWAIRAIGLEPLDGHRDLDSLLPE